MDTVSGDLFSAPEAAAELRVSRWTLYGLVRRGVVRPVPWCRHLRIHIDELDRVKRLTSLDVMCTGGVNVTGVAGTSCSDAGPMAAEPGADLAPAETLPAPPAHTPTTGTAP